MNARDAQRSVVALADAMGGDPYGTKTVAGARSAYINGRIDVAEFERRLDTLFGITAHVPPTEASEHE